MMRVVDWLGDHNGVAAVVLLVVAIALVLLVEPLLPEARETYRPPDNPALDAFCRNIPPGDTGALEDCHDEFFRRNS